VTAPREGLPFAELAARLARRPPTVRAASDRPRAAVAVILAPGPDSVLLIRRAERAGDVWSGQLAFPGGRADPADPDLQATAKRETREEVGLELADARLIGQLDDLVPTSPVLPPILVRPFVFTLREQSPLFPNPEVAVAAWVPLAEFTRPGAFRPTTYRRHGQAVQAMGYHLDLGVVWGLTERILTPLLALVGTPNHPA
jgi:8-oxo-dGTP pyrophosphatase MutT (NUDIX family)